MVNHPFHNVVTAGIFTLTACAALCQKPDVHVVKTVMVSHSTNEDLPSLFNFGHPFVISLNLKIPNGNALKDSLLARFGENGLADKVVFQFFSPVDRREFVGVRFGSRIPLDVAQAVIRAVSGSSDIKIVLALQREDGALGNTQRVYIGSLTQEYKTPVTQDQLRSLLDERISLDEFHKICIGNE